MIATLRTLFPRHFAWRAPRGAGHRYFIDLLSGCDTFRRAVDEGAQASEILSSWQPAQRAFRTQYQEALLYT